jgi:hypothetical protein
MLLKFLNLAELRFSHCATISAHRHNTPLVLTVTAARLLAKNAVNCSTVNTAPPLKSLSLIRPKFLMAAQSKTFSTLDAKIQQASPSYANQTRSRLLDADAAQS